MSPTLQMLNLFWNGKHLSGFEEHDLANLKGWARTGKVASIMMNNALPFSMRDLFDKDKRENVSYWNAAFPTSKGMRDHKARRLFMQAMFDKDQALYNRTVKAAYENGLMVPKLASEAWTRLYNEMRSDALETMSHKYGVKQPKNMIELMAAVQLDAQDKAKAEKIMTLETVTELAEERWKEQLYWINEFKKTRSIEELRKMLREDFDIEGGEEFLKEKK
jgi:hypothetical protein